MTDPPLAPRRPHTISAHGDDRVDEFHWLRDRSDEVIAHLEAENAFTEASLAHTESLREQVYKEIRSHIEETDLSVPTRRGGFWYYSRTIEDKPYPVHCRRPVVGIDRTPPDVEGAAAEEQVLLDVNEASTGHDYFRVATFEVSPDGRLLAWSADTTGGELYTVRFRDLSTGADLDDVIESTYYGATWAADNTTFFYNRTDAAMRPCEIWRHQVGTDAADDEKVFAEDDERFFVGITSSKDDKMLLIHLGSAITSEWHFLASDTPTGDWRVVAPRRQGIEYSVEHHSGRFLIVTNDGAVNYRLAAAAVDNPQNWADLMPPDPAIRLVDVEPFRDFLLLHERADGLTRLRLVAPDGTGATEIELPESPGSVEPSGTPEFDSPLVRYSFSSLITPTTVIDYDVAARTPLIRKRQPVPAYDATDYVTRRSWATASDGTKVPISLVHRKDTQLPAPCMLYGYGSYDVSVDPTFAPIRLPLLDRGAVFAIAHIRGGGEMGRTWYDDGKMLTKRNTFNDFVACADHLIAEGVTEIKRIVARGASAGGLLMGAVTNLRPELFTGVLAQVPFVDCLTTILDPSLPLTVIEWEEWGNPVAEHEVYDYMKSYSPYDNVAALDYPAVLATGGLNDPRVSYWEPAKWVQRLRERTTGTAPILLRTEMGAGHGGPTDRYELWQREALLLGWALSLPGMAAE